MIELDLRVRVRKQDRVSDRVELSSKHRQIPPRGMVFLRDWEEDWVSDEMRRAAAWDVEAVVAAGETASTRL